MMGFRKEKRNDFQAAKMGEWTGTGCARARPDLRVARDCPGHYEAFKRNPEIRKRPEMRRKGGEDKSRKMGAAAAAAAAYRGADGGS
jgi:hypothetical protein